MSLLLDFSKTVRTDKGLGSWNIRQPVGNSEQFKGTKIVFLVSYFVEKAKKSEKKVKKLLTKFVKIGKV